MRLRSLLNGFAATSAALFLFASASCVAQTPVENVRCSHGKSHRKPSKYKDGQHCCTTHSICPLSSKDVKRRKNNGHPCENYDVIVVGAGTSGSNLIYNFARNFPWMKVLVLEAGTDPTQDNKEVRSVTEGPNPNPPNPTFLSSDNDDWGPWLASTRGGATYFK